MVKLAAWLNPWHFYRLHWRLIIKAAAIVTAPSIILGAAADASNGLVSAYLYLAGMLLNVGLIWLVAQLAAGQKPSLKEIYYRGTGNILVFILVTLLLTLQILPLAAGLWVATGIVTITASLAEKLLLGLVGLALAWPTLFWLPRYLLAVFPAVLEPTEPLAALRSSRRLVGNSWRLVLGRSALVLVTGLLMAGLPALLLVTLGNALQQEIYFALLAPLVQIVVNLVVLPWSIIALYQLYQELK